MPRFMLLLSSRLSALRALSLLALIALAACSPEAPPGAPQTDHLGITISDAWVNQPPPEAAVAGAYLRIHNPGVQADRLLGVETQAAQQVEIHEMNMASGMMQMRKLEGGLSLPAGDTIALAPGGLHLMLIAPRQDLNAGDEVTMDLRFEHAPAQTVVFQVRSLLEAGVAPESHHGHH